MKRIISLLLSIVILLALCPIVSVSAAGDMRLAPVFTADMVLQRNEKICIYGTGNGSGSITLGDTTKNVTSTNGSWTVYFDPMKESTTPVTFIANFGGSDIILDDVLIGDVYITSGQSNMELNLSATEQTGTVKGNSLLRFYNKAGKWQQFSDTNVESLSAISVLFADELSKKLNKKVPIGIVSASVGASRVEDWTHRDYCYCEEYDFENTAHSDITKYDKGHHDLYDKYIAPLENMTVAGVLWYQGESNRGAGEAYRYFDMFKTMVNCWRKRFDDSDMPFYTVQIMLCSGDESKDLNGNTVDEYNIRIAQARAAVEIKNVTLCSMLSLSDTLLPSGKLDIHPTNKLPVAKALVNAALATYYKPLGDYSGAAPEYSGPIFKSVNVRGNEATVHFLHTGSGLKNKTNSESVTEFEVRNGSGKWVTADAKIKGDSVVVSAEGVDRIIGVRMGYRNKPSISLYNNEGYCASPFIWEDANAKLDHLAADTWQSDETHHWKLCQVTGCKEIFEKGEHSGSGATCVTKASCDICNRRFGQVDKETHSGETMLKNKKESTVSEQGYSGDTACLSCGTVLAKGKATPLLEKQEESEQDSPILTIIIIVVISLIIGGGVTAAIIIFKNKKAAVIEKEEETELPEE